MALLKLKTTHTHLTVNGKLTKGLDSGVNLESKRGMAPTDSGKMGEWLPGWVLEEVGQILGSDLPDSAAESALRALLRLSEAALVKHGTTSGLLAKKLVEERRKKL